MIRSVCRLLVLMGLCCCAQLHTAIADDDRLLASLSSDAERALAIQLAALTGFDSTQYDTIAHIAQAAKELPIDPAITATSAIHLLESATGTAFDQTVDNADRIARHIIANYQEIYYHGTNSAAAQSIAEHGLNPHVRIYNPDDIDLIHNRLLALGVDTPSALFGNYYANRDRDKVYMTGQIHTALDYAGRSPEWFSAFISPTHFTNRNYDLAITHLEGCCGAPLDREVKHFVDKHWTLFAAATPVIIVHRDVRSDADHLLATYLPEGARTPDAYRQALIAFFTMKQSLEMRSFETPIPPQKLRILHTKIVTEVGSTRMRTFDELGRRAA